MENFTPIASLLGGALIGFSAVLLFALNGKIAGISGIVGRLLTGARDDRAWRIAFLAGLVLGPLAAASLNVAFTPRIDAGIPVLVIAGLLVGYGTQLGNGCTSGHGICGLARFSPRSLTATLAFMAVAIATVFVTRHVIGG
jgi:uncharacterized protein